MPKTTQESADHILPLYINGLSGRMLRLPPQKGHKREILFIYGQHSSLERWWGLAQAINTMGGVTMPDLPGFGGMTSLYKIGQKASIDNLADYLAAFIKLRYKNKKVTIFGMSLGFVIVNRMLQKYPHLSKKVDALVSVVGFAHHDDFIFSKKRMFAYRVGSRFFSRKFPAMIFQGLFLRPFYLRRVYHHSFNAKEKFANLEGDEFKNTMEMEIKLWKINDLRTQMQTAHEMLTLDNTGIRVDLPLYQVASKKDRYFDNVRTEQNLRKIFNDYEIFYTKDPNHAPTIIADKKAAAPFVPAGLKRVLRKTPEN
jgi:pimeloyl-ACP methyl ester carboxylesterase